jgi:hypothetical protein
MDKFDTKENKGKPAIFDYDETTGILIIQEFKIRNKEVVDFLRSYPVEKQEEAMNDVLEFGVKALKSFLTENYGKLIDTHFKIGFSDLDSKLSHKVSEIERNVFQAFIDKAREKISEDFYKGFDVKTKTLMETMRETNQNLDTQILQSFINNLKDNIFATFKTDFNKISEDLKLKLGEYVVKKEILAKTPLKGPAFENYVVELSESIAKTFGDDIEHVGKDNKTGDILIKNISEGFSFCIEVKDTKLSKPDITNVFEEVERTRSVKHSIIVFRNSNEVPEIVGSFYLWGRNRLALTLAEGSEDAPNYFLFDVGYRIMRFLALSQNSPSGEIDIEAFINHVKKIENILGTVSSLKGKVTIFSNVMTEGLDKLKEDIEKEIEEIEDIMKRGKDGKEGNGIRV